MPVTWTKRISTALGLMVLLGTAAVGAPPGRNQATADAVARALRAVPGLAGAPVQIEAREGVVTLSGQVANPALKGMALGRTRQVPGVAAVVDRLRVPPDPRVRPAQYEPPGPAAPGPPAAPMQPMQVALGHHGGGVVYDGAPVGAPPADGTAMAGPAMDPAMLGGPAPEGPALAGGPNAAQPDMPNYAWPSYAPYPNFSAVGYPTVYPWQAWPNIGPFYPYPEVPLDWRAVTLRWDDGLWWLDFKKYYTRPFFFPYPFGLWAY